MSACPEQLASRHLISVSPCLRARRAWQLPSTNPSLRSCQPPLVTGRWPRQGTTAISPAVISAAVEPSLRAAPADFIQQFHSLNSSDSGTALSCEKRRFQWQLLPSALLAEGSTCCSGAGIAVLPIRCLAGKFSWTFSSHHENYVHYASSVQGKGIFLLTHV